MGGYTGPFVFYTKLRLRINRIVYSGERDPTLLGRECFSPAESRRAAKGIILDPIPPVRTAKKSVRGNSNLNPHESTRIFG